MKSIDTLIKYENTGGWEVKEWEKIYHENTTHFLKKKADVAILISENYISEQEILPEIKKNMLYW